MKQLSQKTDLTADYFKSAQVITAQACGVLEHTIKRICCEARNTINSDVQNLCPLFISPHNGYKLA